MYFYQGNSYNTWKTFNSRIYAEDFKERQDGLVDLISIGVSNKYENLINLFLIGNYVSYFQGPLFALGTSIITFSYAQRQLQSKQNQLNEKQNQLDNLEERVTSLLFRMNVRQ